MRAARPHNLPMSPFALVGRARELAKAHDLLRGPARLLTLTGPGGIGKTRLALALAAESVAMFPHGAWFVDLAALGDAALVAPTIAQVLGMRGVSGRPVRARLVDYLRPRRLLLVLDNFEQVLAAGSDVAELLASCPDLKIVVTSREPLHLLWEHLLPVPPLALPSSRGSTTLAHLERVASVALFVERARAIEPAFALTAENAAPVAEICVRLDGLPLAIELAAARTRVLPPAAMLARLQHRLALLRSPATDRPSRHRTLRAAIGWSYDLLSPAEQAVFRRLGAFVGGCTLDAAEGVVATADLGLDVLEALHSLVDKSLVHAAVLDEDAPRFRLLDTTREYALNRLAACGDLEATARRHAAYFLALAERAVPELAGRDQSTWFPRLEREHDNLRAAVRWAVAHGERDTELRLVGALWRFWWRRGYLVEGRHWLQEALMRSAGAPLPLRAQVLNGAGVLAQGQGDYAEAAVLATEGLALFRELDDRSSMAEALTILGSAARLRGDQPRAIAFLSEALALSRAANDAGAIAQALSSLGMVCRLQGEYVRAAALFEESLDLLREVGDQIRVAALLTNLAELARMEGARDKAALLLAESLSISLAVDNRRNVAYAADVAARLAARHGDAPQVARLFGAVDTLFEVIGVARRPEERVDYADAVEAVRTALGERAFAAAWEEGRVLTPAEVVEQALAVLAARPTPGRAARGPTPSDRPGVGLSERESEVLQLVGAGLSNKAIARQLGISAHTARFHVVSVLNKLGADTRAHAVALAAQRGLL